MGDGCRCGPPHAADGGKARDAEHPRDHRADLHRDRAHFVAGRSGLFSRADMRVLGKFVINFALPALILLSQRQVADILNVRYLAAYALGSLAVLLGTFAFARFVQPKACPCRADRHGCRFQQRLRRLPDRAQVVGPPAAVASRCAWCRDLADAAVDDGAGRSGPLATLVPRAGSSVAGLLRNRSSSRSSGFAVAWSRFRCPGCAHDQHARQCVDGRRCS
jgi:hypothetical protein